MKITGARTEPFAAIRKRALVRAGAQVAVREVSAPDSAAFLGLSETDLTPKVIEALQTLMTEIEDLRSEVSALKLRLNEAQNLADMDALTPVLNRRAFLREMKRVAAFAQRFTGRQERSKRSSARPTDWSTISAIDAGLA